MFRVSVFLFICTLFCSCVWNDTERNPDFLVLDDSEYPYAGLPRLVIETEDFAQIADRETEHSAKLQIYGENSPESDVLDLEIKGRGNSSFSMAKYSIKLKFENKQSLFGMPKDKEWDLVANHRDKSMLRNYMTYQLARTLHDSYSPRNQFVEVFLNRRYMGVYMLVEHIKVSPQRVKIYEDDSSYLFEKTSANATGENLITTDMDFIYDICYPKNPTAQIKETLKSHLNAFESFLQSKTINNIDSLRNWIDIDDFIRYYWIQEFSHNTDGAFRRSHFITWQKGLPMQMGPVWDFDIAYGISSNGVESPQNWYVKKYGWYRLIFKNKQVKKMVDNYWQENRNHFEDMLDFIDQTWPKLDKAMQNEFKRWPVLENDSEWPFIEAYDSYEDAVNALKEWINQRLKWVDENYDL